MEQITLCPMTRDKCHQLFRDWQNDPAVYADPADYRPYTYDAAAVDRYFDARQQLDRVVLAVMLADRPIGEVSLKHIDREKGVCALGIHLQNDSVKGRGYGTQAERLAVRYAFDMLGLHTVLADALIANTRSRRALEKAGFAFVEEKDGFRYYRIDRGS